MNKDILSEKINGKNILITGGTGSFGNKMVEILLQYFNPNKIIIFSRDEYKQSLMASKFSPDKYTNIRYFLGDIRDIDRLNYALKDVDIIFHAAALKQVPALEYNPTEAIKTNIYGTENIIRSSIQNKVKYVIFISTDKAVDPINLYGATKLCAERLIIDANHLSGKNGTYFSIVRYGNVWGSRGSVIPIFMDLISKNMPLPITDQNMTRFTMTLDDAIIFTLNSFGYKIGGETFIPKLKSYRIIDIAKYVINHNINNINNKINDDMFANMIQYTGLRAGEKLHECLISKYENIRTLNCKKFNIILPLLLSKNYEKYYAEFDIYISKNTEQKEYNSYDNIYINYEEIEQLLNY